MRSVHKPGKYGNAKISKRCIIALGFLFGVISIIQSIMIVGVLCCGTVLLFMKIMAHAGMNHSAMKVICLYPVAMGKFQRASLKGGENDVSRIQAIKRS